MKPELKDESCSGRSSNNWRITALNAWKTSFSCSEEHTRIGTLVQQENVTAAGAGERPYLSLVRLFSLDSWRDIFKPCVGNSQSIPRSVMAGLQGIPYPRLCLPKTDKEVIERYLFYISQWRIYIDLFSFFYQMSMFLCH